jgi:type I restriction enzyme S subunit
MTYTNSSLVDEEVIIVGRKGNVGDVQYFADGVWPIDTVYYFTVPDLLNAKYFFLNLQSKEMRKLDSSTSTPSLRREDMERVKVEIPPLAEQERIVEILEEQLLRLDAALESVRVVRSLLIRLRASVLKATADGSLLELDFNSWTKTTVGQIAEVRGGIQKQPKRRPTENPIPFLRVANVGRGVLDLSEVHQIEIFEGELEKYRLEKGDLLVVEGNGSIDQIGRAATWGGSIPDCVHQNHLIRVRPQGSIDANFLASVWNSPGVINQLKEVASSTTGLHTLSTAKVKGVQIAFPTLHDQIALMEESRRWMALIGGCKARIDNATALANQMRRSLLHAAFTGRLTEQWRESVHV